MSEDGRTLPTADDAVDYLEPPLPPDEGDEELPQEEPAEEIDEGEPPSQTAVDEAPQRRPGRRERQAAAIRAAQEENKRLRDEIAEVRRAVQQQYRPPGPDPVELARREQAEREHVAQMDYGQQIQYWRDKDTRALQQQMQQQQLSMAQLIDKNNWDTSARSDPVRARFSPQVEQVMQSELAAGRVQSREVIYHYLLGQEADRARQNRGANGSRQAARRVAAQQTRPSGTRSDGVGGGPQGRRPASDTSYEASLERIKGQPIWG